MTTEYKIITENEIDIFYLRTYEEVLASLKENGVNLRFLEDNQTLEMCKVALEREAIDVEIFDAVKPEFYQELGIASIAKLAKSVYKLYFYQGKYVAGCRGPWSADQALNHWNEFHYNPERAKLFTKAIIENEIALKYPPEEKLYFVVSVTGSSGNRIKMNLIPIPHEEAIVLKSKITNYPTRTLELEEYIQVNKPPLTPSEIAYTQQGCVDLLKVSLDDDLNTN
jgi:hypothetical protein